MPQVVFECYIVPSGSLDSGGDRLLFDSVVSFALGQLLWKQTSWFWSIAYGKGSSSWIWAGCCLAGIAVQALGLTV